MNTQLAVTVLVIVGCILLLSLVSRQSSVDVAGPLRLWLWRRDARRMQARHEFPQSIRRAYWSAREYERDAAQLRVLGYVVASEEASDPYVNLPSVPSFPGFGRGSAVQRRRRVPSHYVTYERAQVPEGAGAPQR